MARVRTVVTFVVLCVGVLIVSGNPVAAESSEAVRGTAARAITAGTTHTCALSDDGSIRCWGANGFGQLGRGNAISIGGMSGDLNALAAVPLGARATAVAAGDQHTCALLVGGVVKCWGYASTGQLGYGASGHLGDEPGEIAALAPVNLGSGRTARAIATGKDHTCAILDTGALKCWGYNGQGQLGQDSNRQAIGDDDGEMATLAAVNLGAGRTARAVTAGESHTCALLDNFAVKCWGGNLKGQLGLDISDQVVGNQSGDMAGLPTVNLGSGRTARAVSAGKDHTCVVLDTGAVKCWGWGWYGQLGIGTTSDMGNSSGEVAGLGVVNLGAGRRAVGVTAGKEFTCALRDDRSVVCWGHDPWGQLGIGSNDGSIGDAAGEMGAALVPVAFPTGRYPRAVTAGAEHACALLDDATLRCWGNNFEGQTAPNGWEDVGDEPGEMGDALAVMPLPRKVGTPAVAIRATGTPRGVRVGDTITYTVTVRNTGDLPLTTVAVTSRNTPRCDRNFARIPTDSYRTYRCSVLARRADIGTRTMVVRVTTSQGVAMSSTPVSTRVRAAA